jgi:solute carrier family 32 (vesicular inhibitory amino acid transporter)
MAEEQGDRCSSIEVPLLVDEKVYQVNDSNGVVSKNKDQYHMVHVGNASSFKTCFHLVNAISGSFLAFYLIVFITNYHFSLLHILILCP